MEKTLTKVEKRKIEEAIWCIEDLGNGIGGWAWEEVIQELQEILDNHAD